MAEQSAEVMALHNTRSGRIFIFGTGPSLVEQRPVLERLKDEATFSCNGLPLWKDLPFVPMYHGVSDIYDMDVLGRMAFDHLDMQRFQVTWHDKHLPRHPAYLFIKKAHDHIQVFPNGFVGLDDDLPPIPTGRTTPLTLAQVAAWMGYREFYFLGLDCSVDYCYGKVDAYLKYHKGGGDHTGHRYLQAIQRCFGEARRAVEAVGGCMCDCTPDGFLSGHGARRGAPAKSVLPYKLLEEVR